MESVFAGPATSRPAVRAGGSLSPSLPLPIGSLAEKYVQFLNRIVIIGCGSIAQGIIPLLLRHIDVDVSRIEIITADDRGRELARELGIKFTVCVLRPHNLSAMLHHSLGRGDFCLNLSVGVSSAALMRFCHSVGAMYLDTCTEPWPGGYDDESLDTSLRTNFAQRQEVLDLREEFGPSCPTMVLCHGANPGLVSHFVKAALVRMAIETDFPLSSVPTSRDGWAQLMRDLDVKVVQISERDTQTSAVPKRRAEFVNTWSIDGFVSEGAWQPAELGWGSHERELPHGAKLQTNASGVQVAYLDRPGCEVKALGWTPCEGQYHGFMITHNESCSMAEYYRCRGDGSSYQPTVYYCYHPCDMAVLSLHECAGTGLRQQPRQRLIVDEITSGMDELGVLLMGHPKGSFWYGSQLTIEQARALAPFQNATGLQVTASALGAMVWAIEHPKMGVLEADELDYRRVLEIALPYLGTVVGRWTDWTPLMHRRALFPERLDTADPWQLRNFVPHLSMGS